MPGGYNAVALPVNRRDVILHGVRSGVFFVKKDGVLWKFAWRRMGM
jgi:branched-subunit amino acid aminotransferase/4-amino-4-deoxychorismate lyase